MELKRFWCSDLKLDASMKRMLIESPLKMFSIDEMLLPNLKVVWYKNVVFYFENKINIKLKFYDCFRKTYFRWLGYLPQSTHFERFPGDKDNKIEKALDGHLTNGDLSN
ncbi:hypothetical protein BpHYR1_030254 [Brachionus plicatilis]|uniref:Uncharacterized protein n=1 Tax=Brachionus plicatilis TaxID=10195 RepID=A0A3M7P6Q4_BRAPC|nr:hypothetical protein BpHYR1_030254 [Brachionus plicatilis]